MNNANAKFNFDIPPLHVIFIGLTISQRQHQLICLPGNNIVHTHVYVHRKWFIRGLIYNFVNIDSYKLVICKFQVGDADKPHLVSRINQINVSNFCVFSHYPIGIMTKSFPVHVRCARIFLGKCFEPDINRLYLRCLGFAGFFWIFIQERISVTT